MTHCLEVMLQKWLLNCKIINSGYYVHDLNTFLRNTLLHLPSLLRACLIGNIIKKVPLPSYLVVTHKAILMLEMEILCCKGSSDYKE